MSSEKFDEEYFADTYHRPDICEKCGAKLEFVGVGAYRCIKCRHEMYDDYGKVRNYLEKHPGANAGEVSDETGVAEKTITHMLREERLQVSKDSKTFLKCEVCGKPIISGKYCKTCGDLAKAADKKKKEQRERKKREMMIQGVGMVTHEDDGKRRFDRDSR